MKKLLKSAICGSVNSARMHCSPWKSQPLRLLFNEQCMNSRRITPETRENKNKNKKKQKNKKKKKSGKKKRTKREAANADAALAQSKRALRRLEAGRYGIIAEDEVGCS